MQFKFVLLKITFLNSYWSGSESFLMLIHEAFSNPDLRAQRKYLPQIWKYPKVNYGDLKFIHLSILLILVMDLFLISQRDLDENKIVDLC